MDNSSPFQKYLNIFSLKVLVTQSCLALCDPMDYTAHQASLSFTISQSLLKLKSIESVMPPNCLFLCCPLLLMPSIFPSIRFFSNESVLCIRWPEYWSYSFSISPCNEFSGLISFRIDWFDLLALEETHKSSLVPQFESLGIQSSLWSNSHIYT